METTSTPGSATSISPPAPANPDCEMGPACAALANNIAAVTTEHRADLAITKGLRGGLLLYGRPQLLAQREQLRAHAEAHQLADGRAYAGGATAFAPRFQQPHHRSQILRKQETHAVRGE